ncbi:hypothetical protein M948_16995 [Virgibacillus sp. CM-4]|nr:hypothetical protein M948_16995 [Virgibacillus sp. CM-4]
MLIKYLNGTAASIIDYAKAANISLSFEVGGR